jgi:hypothetical protein
MTATFKIERDASSKQNTDLLVSLTVAGTAILGLDYSVSGALSFTDTSATVIILANELFTEIIITPLTDIELENSETVILTVVSTANTYVAGTDATATFTILDKPVIQNTVLLLHFDENTSVDSSFNPVDFYSPDFINVRADAKFGAGNFHTWDGSIKIGYTPKLANLLTGNMCIELWVSNKIFEYSSIAYIFEAPTYFLFKIFKHKTFQFQFLDGLGDFLTATVTLTSTPIHVALTKENDTYRLFFNGILQTTVVKLNPPIDNFDPDIHRYKIGQHNNVTDGLYFDEMRITRNDPVYTANFTPPTIPFTV